MILQNLVLPGRVNQMWTHNGIDSPDKVPDKKHFSNYPHTVTYQYNSRGFRDTEWPTDLDTALWCLGDSFTVGIGAPFAHIWPQVLQQQTTTRTINVSMDGASNQWIARRARQILEVVSPSAMIIQWSFINRRELSEVDAIEQRWQNFYNNVKDASWPLVTYQQQHLLPQYIQEEIKHLHKHDCITVTDEDLRLGSVDSTTAEDIADSVACIKSLLPWESNTRIIHSFVPKFAPADYTTQFFESLEPLPASLIKLFPVLDRARDGYHYDLMTAQHLVGNIIQLLNK